MPRRAVYLAIQTWNADTSEMGSTVMTCNSIQARTRNEFRLRPATIFLDTQAAAWAEAPGVCSELERSAVVSPLELIET